MLKSEMNADPPSVIVHCLENHQKFSYVFLRSSNPRTYYINSRALDSNCYDALFRSFGVDVDLKGQ